MALDLAAARKTRTASKGWATRAAVAITNILEKQNVKRATVERAIETYDQRLTALDNAQANVEILIDDGDLDADIEQAGQFRENLEEARTAASDWLFEHPAPRAPSRSQSGTEASINSLHIPGTGSGSHRSHAHNFVKLPRLELPKFGGEIEEWPSFWERFSAAVDTRDLPVVNKFTYLLSVLTGLAKTAISGLTLTEANYITACELLKHRFGRRELIINSHIQKLLALSTSQFKGNATSCLRQLYQQINIHVRSLEALEVTGESYGVILAPVILSRVPYDIRLEWARSSAGKESNLEELLSFLKTEVELRERSEAVKQMFPDSSSSKESQDVQHARVEKRRMTSASSLQTSSTVENCVFCNLPNHASKDCRKALNMPQKECIDKAKRSWLCYCCLDRGHVSHACKRKIRCTHCGGNHNRILCIKARKPASKGVNHREGSLSEQSKHSDSNSSALKEPEISHTNFASSKNNGGNMIAMKLAKVLVSGTNGPVEAILFFDEGSDRSYVSASLVKKVQPEQTSFTRLGYSVFGGKRSSVESRRNYNLVVNAANCPGELVSFTATEVDVISSTRKCVSFDDTVTDKLNGLPLAMNYLEDQEVDIDILVGLDHEWSLIKDGKIRLSQYLVAEETVFGWVVSGRIEDRSVSDSQLSEHAHPFVCMSSAPISAPVNESLIRQFWELESLGINPKEKRVDDKVLVDFEKQVTFKEGRYEVCLPWKNGDNLPCLMDNKRHAYGRLNRLTSKLENNVPLKVSYNEVFRDLQKANIIEEVPVEEVDSCNPTCYLPHRPVVRELSLTTKVRPVLDGSAPGPNGVSLNDCLDPGPSLIPNIVEVIIRFRRWLVALTADISKAFLQIALARQDRDAHRFLWQSDTGLKIMRFCRVTFGINCSPFLLNATIKHHLASVPWSPAVQELSDNLYVDDFLSGADSEAEASTLFSEAYSIMLKAGMVLSKWVSNSDSIRRLFQSSEMTPGQTEGRVLGLKWNANTDCFEFEGLTIEPTTLVTKRVVLSFLARIFDPLGFLVPCLMLAKVLFQQVWRLGVDWDTELPVDVATQFVNWLDSFKVIKTLEIPRCYFGVAWGQIHRLELHVFCDASEVGYAGVVYLRIPVKEKFAASFVVAKARVAPLKRVCLPRLELLSCVLGARLLQFTLETLKLGKETSYRCWSDSKVALAWIRSNPHRWKPFVGNRVAEIQDLSDPSCWFHCPGKENPADLATRGISASELISKSELWLRGPPWLSKPEDCFPSDVKKEPQVENVATEEEMVTGTCFATRAEQIPTPEPALFDWKRCSSFQKLIRIAGWVNRFVSNCHRTRDGRTGDLCAEELRKGKLLLFQLIQKEYFPAEIAVLSNRPSSKVPKNSRIGNLDPFLDDSGLLRIRGRLQLSSLSYEEKHPIILPSCHLSMLLVRSQHVFLKHAGVESLLSSLRDNYWIIGARKIAKQVKRYCVSCLRQDSRACNQTIAPLPAKRITEAPPFAVSGVDFAGPLYCADFAGQKFYLCLFTCAVVRALHLELVNSMSVADFLPAFRRFVARRGLPSTMFSDNARTFKKAKRVLQRTQGDRCIEWKFIAPRAPWWGGFWERLVGSVKSALKKSIGSACLSKVELETVLVEIEACVNSRPLTFVGDCPDTPNALCPNHFLLGRRFSSQSAGVDIDANIDRKVVNAALATRSALLGHFWKAWKTLYIRSLPSVSNKLKPYGNIGIGSIVLIQEDNLPRLKWLLGRVLEAHTSSDGYVRSVTLKTVKGNFVRPIQRLHLLEVDSPVDPVAEVEEAVEAPEGSGNAVKRAPDPVAGKERVTPVVPDVTRTRTGRMVKPVRRLDL